MRWCVDYLIGGGVSVMGASIQSSGHNYIMLYWLSGEDDALELSVSQPCSTLAEGFKALSQTKPEDIRLVKKKLPSLRM
jgi:hypothetical protein